MFLEDAFLKTPHEILETIYQHREDIKHPLLKAIFLQLLWQYKTLGKNGYVTTIDALNAYLDNAKSLIRLHKKGHQQAAGQAKDTLEHAYRFAKKVTNKPFQNKLIRYVFRLVHRTYTKKDSSLILYAFQLLAIMAPGKTRNQEALNIILAIIPQLPANDWFTQQCFYDCAIQFASLLNQKDSVLQLKKQQASTFIQQAAHSKETGQKIHFLSCAVGIYKTIQGSRPLWEPLLQEIGHLYQQQQMEMCSIRAPEVDKILQNIHITASKNAKILQTRLQGTSLQQKLCLLAAKLDLPSQEDIEKSLPKTPSLIDSIATTIHGENGLPVCTLKGDSRRTTFSFIQSLNFFWATSCEFWLTPILHSINMEHHVTALQILPFCMHNAFIPPKHEYLFALGLAYFIKGQFIEAGSLLIPQIENCFRHILAPYMPTFRLEKETSESYIKVEALINELAERKIIPQHMAFNFQMLLVEKAFNVRNDIAHGKVVHQQFSTAPFVMPVWMILWFIMYPFLQDTQSQAT